LEIWRSATRDIFARSKLAEKSKEVFVSKLRVIALAGAAAAALAGTALAATPKTHVMNIALPDGSVARVEYVGDVPPKVTVAPGPLAGLSAECSPLGLPAFAGFGKMIEQMNRETQAMIRQAQQMARQAPNGAAAPYIAAYGDAPAGATSTSIVSFRNGAGTCTRTTQTVSQGPGKPPKVTSSVSGDCGPSGAAAPADPLNRT